MLGNQGNLLPHYYNGQALTNFNDQMWDMDIYKIHLMNLIERRDVNWSCICNVK